MTALPEPQRQNLSRPAAVAAFACFAFAYFFSALVRGVVATLAPVFSADLGLGAADLGLLAGAYFLGFATTQLPLGGALDRFGARRVLVACLGLAVVGCGLFAMAASFAGLISARVLIGMGVSACLMAPLTFFRHRFTPHAQMRGASWMLMTGSLGMVAATLPVQWLLPALGWRGIFWAVAACLAAAIAAIVVAVPDDPSARSAARLGGGDGGYREVFAHRSFVRLMPMGFFHYGGFVALQTLWIGPWLSQVCAWTPQQAAQGLFALNLAMLLSFLSWGLAVPRLAARGWTAQVLIARCTPVSLIVLVAAVVAGSRSTAWVWALFCITSSVVTLSQPAIGQVFPSRLAGRALSAYNLVIFLGVFTLQWTLGGIIDRLEASGWPAEAAFQGAFAALAAGCVAAYVWFRCLDDGERRSTDNPTPCRES